MTEGMRRSWGACKIGACIIGFVISATEVQRLGPGGAIWFQVDDMAQKMPVMVPKDDEGVKKNVLAEDFVDIIAIHSRSLFLKSD